MPLPLVAPENVIQAALLVDDHVQPVCAVTVTVPVPPPATTDGLLVGEIAKLHGTPACVTVNVWPAMVSVPVREDVELLAATE